MSEPPGPKRPETGAETEVATARPGLRPLAGPLAGPARPSPSGPPRPNPSRAPAPPAAKSIEALAPPAPSPVRLEAIRAMPVIALGPTPDEKSAETAQISVSSGEVRRSSMPPRPPPAPSADDDPVATPRAPPRDRDGFDSLSSELLEKITGGPDLEDDPDGVDVEVESEPTPEVESPPVTTNGASELGARAPSALASEPDVVAEPEPDSAEPEPDVVAEPEPDSAEEIEPEGVASPRLAAPAPSESAPSGQDPAKAAEAHETVEIRAKTEIEPEPELAPTSDRISEPPPEVDPEDVEISEAPSGGRAARGSEAQKEAPIRAIINPALAAALQPHTTPSEPAPRRARYWWDELFGDDFLRTMDRLTDAQIKAEVTFIEESLAVQRGGIVLDLACGSGRHAVELASRGYNVVGYDLSVAMLARAADEAQERGQKLNFLHGDMREMGFEEMFDGIYCWSTSFGYFDDEKNQMVAQHMYKALRHGGMLLLDVVNRDFVALNQPSLVWFEGDGCVCMDEMRVDFITSRLKVKRMVMLDDGRSRELEYSIRLYTLHELGRMLHDIGFKVTEVSGQPSIPGVFFGAESPRIIVLAEKA